MSADPRPDLDPRSAASVPLRADLPAPGATLSGWGRFPARPAHLAAPADLEAAAAVLRRQVEGIAPRGLGRRRRPPPAPGWRWRRAGSTASTPSTRRPAC